MNNKTIYTDFDGNFVFENVEPGVHDLVTDYVTYKNEVIGIDVASGKEVRIELESR